MKSITLPILMALLLSVFASQVQAQVTLTQSNFPRPASFVDSTKKAVITGISLPTEGPAQQWDYSNLLVQENTSKQYFDASGDSSISGALSRYSSDLIFQVFVIPSDEYDALDTEGWYEKGKVNRRAAYSIATLSGGPNDSLIFNDFVDEFEGRINLLKFPMTYQSSWAETRIERTQFELTVAAFSLNRAPGLQKRYVSQTREVVGYGNLVIPKSDGSPSAGLEVLLLKTVRSVEDSFFLGGAPAPPALLAAFGLVQGSVASDSFYVFYKPDFHAVVLNVNMEGNAVSSVFFRPQAADGVPSTGIRDQDLLGIRSYPNPLAAGERFTLELDKPVQAGSLRLLDLSGRILHQTELAATPTRQLQFTVPEQLGKGLYILQLNDAQGNLRGSQKLLLQ